MYTCTGTVPVHVLKRTSYVHAFQMIAESIKSRSSTIQVVNKSTAQPRSVGGLNKKFSIEIFIIFEIFTCTGRSTGNDLRFSA